MSHATTLALVVLLTLASPARGQIPDGHAASSGSAAFPMSYPSCDNGEAWLREHNFPKCSRVSYDEISYDEICTVNPFPAIGVEMECQPVPEFR